tara:strand:+ start:10087 stop:10518 length:432 start_codon:yes stop_codon:yes gene_type:complete
MIIKDCSIVVDSLDMSDWLRALTFSEEVEQQDATVHGDNFRSFEAGLRTGTLTAQFRQDFTDDKVDEKLSSLLADTDGFTVVIKPTSGGVADANPSFTATMNLESYERFDGSDVGSEGLCTATFVLAQTAAGVAQTGFARATS